MCSHGHAFYLFLLTLKPSFLRFYGDQTMLRSPVCDSFFLVVCYQTDEIEFDCSLRISRGDNFRLSLADPASPQFRTKSDRYRRLV